MVWTYRGKVVVDVPDAAICFVYRITRKDSGRSYIGKKMTKFKGHKQVNKKRKRILKESDWKTYRGSSVELQEEIQQLGEDAFEFEILRWCAAKGEASYHEAKLQFAEDVLYHPDKYYNSFIGCKIHAKHLKL